MQIADQDVSRIGGVTEASGNEILASLFPHILAKRGHLLKIHQVVAHAPKMLRAQAAYASALREDSSLPRDLQELLIMRVAQINDSRYEQSVHWPIAVACGVPPAKLEHLSQWNTGTIFTPNECTALAFVDQAAAGGEVTEELFEELVKAFSLQQIVELTALIAWYVGNSRFVRALRIASEVAADSRTSRE